MVKFCIQICLLQNDNRNLKSRTKNFAAWWCHCYIDRYITSFTFPFVSLFANNFKNICLAMAFNGHPRKMLKGLRLQQICSASQSQCAFRCISIDPTYATLSLSGMLRIKHKMVPWYKEYFLISSQVTQVCISCRAEDSGMILSLYMRGCHLYMWGCHLSPHDTEFQIS